MLVLLVRIILCQQQDIMVYGVLVVPQEQVFFGEPFVIYYFIWEYSFT